MDKLPVLYEVVLVEVVGLLELVTIPDLPASACKAVIAESLELASLQNLVVVLLNLVVEIAGYSMEHQLKVKVVMLEDKASSTRKMKKCSVDAEILQDPADQIVEVVNLL